MDNNMFKVDIIDTIENEVLRTCQASTLSEAYMEAERLILLYQPHMEHKLKASTEMDRKYF